VSLSSDAQSMLVSTLDSRIRLLDATNGTLLNEYKGHLNKSYRIKSCMSLGEATVLAGDENGRIWEWRIDQVRCVYYAP
jgi:mitogen-activated protein kinase organizer 1